MSLDDKKKALIDLSQFLQNHINEVKSNSEIDLHHKLNEAIELSQQHNTWFTNEFIYKSLSSWSKALNEINLKTWLSNYNLEDLNPNSHVVAIICAGNIPLVGFHDCLCGLITGHNLIIKYSSKDQFLLRFMVDFLLNTGAFSSQVIFTDGQLNNFDAVIATGSNNTSRYFEYYFRNKASIIRKNRNSVAVLTGQETSSELEKLGQDIFSYFGLGCRNVSKLYVPENYDFKHFFESIYKFSDIINHHKYANNYDYNKAVYLMSDIKLFDNNFIILKHDTGFSSPIACLFYEYYSDENQLVEELQQKESQLQCVVGNTASCTVRFGETQSPELWDYADGIDTMNFLLNL
ncbi:acyl-CoA reductase [Psychroflexus sp. ALD_RP9]|uniref:acyl-CoA reductase n=1 Tax=Psychroflexus sp. ALD_RP9 TaxID=2777186 RepID=UPI001A8CA1CD|nr:acyl-CoA reductase [Psychroflexus sp. ALD_RP9]QSS97064.1 acyl-CoA reductase [Psychroflexus sp. ALD_RP9]